MTNTSLLSKQSIADELDAKAQDYVGSDFATMFSESFSYFDQTPYIIGTYKANYELMNYHSDNEDNPLDNGPLAAINDIIEYSDDYDLLDAPGSEIANNLANPEWVASAVAYTIARPLFEEALEEIDLEEDDEITNETAKRFIDALKANIRSEA